MSIRNLGDWSALGLGYDPVHADPDKVAAAQKRYQDIATTIDDAVARLQKVLDDNSQGLVGQYIEGLRKSADSLHDRLSKAGARYHDVADQIKIYEPELQHGLDESAGALADARSAVDAQHQANGMPDPQKGSDGSISPQEQQKGTDKTHAVNQADDSLNAAKHRLNAALDQLNVAGKRLGDAVNGKNYKDGLTDTFKDKLDVILGKISQILGAIGMALAGLALLVPGLDAVVLAGVVVGAATLAVNSVLYHDGKGSLLDVVFGAVGLGLAGIGVGVAQLAKGLANEAKGLADEVLVAGTPRIGFRPGAFGQDFGRAMEDDIPLRPLGDNPGAGGPRPNTWTRFNFYPQNNAATNWAHLSDWYNNPLTNKALPWLGTKLGKLPGNLGTYGRLMGDQPEVGFWGSLGPQSKGALDMWKGLGTDPLKSLGDWAGVLGGWSGYKGLSAIRGAINDKISPAWYVWGGFNGLYGLFGIGYTGGRLKGVIPSVNP